MVERAMSLLGRTLTKTERNARSEERKVAEWADALDAGMTTRKLAENWKRHDGTSYTHTHVRFVAGAWHAFGNLGFQDRPRFNDAYHSPEVRKGKSAMRPGPVGFAHPRSTARSQARRYLRTVGQREFSC